MIWNTRKIENLSLAKPKPFVLVKHLGVIDAFLPIELMIRTVMEVLRELTSHYQG
jgi:hypothetical protein